MVNSQIYEKLKKLEHDIWELKLYLMKSGEIRYIKKNTISLEGIWKDINISEEEIENSKRSLFPIFEDL